MIITGVGRLSKEPKMSFTPKGTAQTHISVAFTCGYGSNKETVWVSAWAYGQQAEFINQYFDKSSRIELSLDVTGMYTYSKEDGTTGGSINAKVLTAGFVDKSKKKEESTPFEDEVIDVEDF